jgi:adenine-specific DNA-methyltransferase
MSKTTKLELTWIGKENRPRLEPRILIEDANKSYHAKAKVSDLDFFDNRLIHGDNLLALKALEQEFAGKIKCVFIDPPYNTGSAFSHYEDGLEHSLWLTLLRDRLELLRRLLAEDGSLWMTIDDNEAHYLKVLCDEVFGRQNFVANVIWQKKFSPQANAVWLSDSHDHVLVFAKRKEIWRPNLLERSESADSRYDNPDNDARGAWTSGDFTISLTGGQRGAQFARTGVSANIYRITTPSGRRLMPTRGRCWGASEERFKELIADNRIWFGEDGNNVPRIKRFLSEVQSGMVCMTVWLRDDVGDNQEAKREVMAFNRDEVFSTPKPERLMKRIIHLATKEGDWVLDSFAGSGTTGAVAHKMKRRWIMVEVGRHSDSHILPRMQKVIDGKDPAGVSESCGWRGGGGFRYYHLASSLLEKDRFGNWIISKHYNGAMLAEAMCKFEGFTFAPSDTEYWLHGHSTERDFIYVTTQSLTREQLQKLSDDVGEKRSLLVCCSAFRAKDVSQFQNLTIKKIPKMVLNRCEWGRDDYSLEIKSLPELPPALELAPVTPTNGRRKTIDSSMNLFDAAAEESHS